MGEIPKVRRGSVVRTPPSGSEFGGEGRPSSVSSDRDRMSDELNTDRGEPLTPELEMRSTHQTDPADALSSPRYGNGGMRVPTSNL